MLHGAAILRCRMAVGCGRRSMGDAPGGEPGGAPGVAPGSEPAAAAVGGREGEAMGVSYQALAISPAALPPPAPFGAA